RAVVTSWSPISPSLNWRTGAIVNPLRSRNGGLSNATATTADSVGMVVDSLGVASIPDHPEDYAYQLVSNRVGTRPRTGETFVQKPPRFSRTVTASCARGPVIGESQYVEAAGRDGPRAPPR